MDVDHERLRSIVERFADTEIVVLGDLIADEYIIGDTDRVSREAPVLILKYQRAEIHPGGAANALMNFRVLGARATALGVVGDDDAGRYLIEHLASCGADSSAVLVDGRIETVRKTRVMAGGFHTVRQQIVRIDRETQLSDPPEWEERIYQSLLEREDQVRAVLFSDYGQGAISPALAAKVIELGRRRNWCLCADSRHRLEMFTGATAACPNESEAGPAAGVQIIDEESLRQAGSVLLQSLNLEGLVITRGRFGMALFEPQAPMVSLPTYLECDAADVTGAGDTVAAVLTLSLSVGASLLEASMLASCAGSLVVMKRGTAAISAEEMLAAL